MKNHKRAWAEVSLSKLESNINIIKSGISSCTDIMAVVKADAYGHGEKEIIKKLCDMGIKYFAVSNLDEAISVRKITNDSEILILGYTPPEFADELSDNNIIQCIVTPEYAGLLSKSASGTVRCHVKIDTGMGRIGFKFDTPEECSDEIIKIMKFKNLDIDGIFTHFAVADSDRPENIEYTDKQSSFIKHVYAELCKKSVRLRHIHFLNSAGVSYHYDSASTLARVGITMYGLYPNYPLELPYKLEPVMEFKAVVSDVKTISKGDSVSYGRTFIAPSAMKVATVTVGYADGYSRLLSSKGFVLYKGVRCPITGRVCMDQMMIDVSEVKNASAGDTVTLIGKDGNDQITADELASWYGTIGYEVVCGISKRVPRIYID